MPTTASANPQRTMPGLTVANNAVAATETSVNPTRNGLRTPAWSAMPPKKGEVRAKRPIETETAKAHQKSPRHCSWPKTVLWLYGGKRVADTMGDKVELVKA